MSTKIVVSGDVYVVNQSWNYISNKLNDEQKSWINMMDEYGDLEVFHHVSEKPDHTVQQFIDVVDVGVVSAQMDGWDPEE